MHDGEKRGGLLSTKEVCMKSKYLWLRVTPDKYELPVVVADSLSDLARLCCVSPAAICRGVKEVESGLRKFSVWVRVQDPGEEEV